MLVSFLSGISQTKRWTLFKVEVLRLVKRARLEVGSYRFDLLEFSGRALTSSLCNKSWSSPTLYSSPLVLFVSKSIC